MGGVRKGLNISGQFLMPIEQFGIRNRIERATVREGKFDARKLIETESEPACRFPDRLRDHRELAVLPAIDGQNPVGFLEIDALEHDCFAPVKAIMAGRFGHRLSPTQYWVVAPGSAPLAARCGRGAVVA